ncbi:MAG: AAA family ATPase [Armatimonadota bacterium]
MKRVVVLAGPNGSGKTSIVEKTNESSCFPTQFINPDAIAREMAFTQHATGSTIPRAVLHYADILRKDLIAAGQSFAIETITSLAFMQYARAIGYRVELVFVTTSDPEINKARVRMRVEQGGHDIPPDKIEANYARSMKQLADAVRIADEAKVYDNSLDHPFLVFHKRTIDDVWVISPESRPSWVDEFLIQPLLASGDLPVMTSDPLL